MNLPHRQQQLYDLLFGRGDVLIVDLYAALREDDDALTVAYKQQILGPYITRLNRRIAGQRLKVEPGALKNTYRLVAI